MVSIGRINSFHITKDVASLVSEICLENRMLPLIHACDKVFTSFFNSLFVLDFEGKVHSGRDESEMQRHQTRARVEHPAVQRECKAFKDS